MIHTNVGQILFDIPSNLPFCGGSEGVHTGSLARHACGGHVQRLKPGLRHAFSVGLEVQKSFRGQNGMPFRRNLEIVVERVVLDFLHVVPIGDDTVHDNGAQYLCPALGWRLRSHRGWRVRPPLGVAPRSPRHAGGNAHLSNDTYWVDGRLSVIAPIQTKQITVGRLCSDSSTSYQSSADGQSLAGWPVPPHL